MRKYIPLSFVTFLLILFTSLCSKDTIAQVIKLKTSSIAFKSKINDYSWTNWSEWEESTMLVVMNLDKDRFTIYSKETQVYDIAEYEGKKTDKDGDESWTFYCINEDGLACRVKFLKLHSRNERKQLYVSFKDMRWVYNVYSLD